MRRQTTGVGWWGDQEAGEEKGEEEKGRDREEELLARCARAK
jgi:hypothetical protein